MRKMLSLRSACLGLMTTTMLGTGLNAYAQEQTSQAPNQQQSATANQWIEVKGVVHDSYGDPLQGANIRITHGRRVWAATSDTDGKFSVRVQRNALDGNGATMTVSYLGMKKETLSVTPNRTSFEVTLKDGGRELGEAIVTGYGSITTRERTSSITSLKMDDILVPGMTSIEQALEGRVPDMIFMQNSGEVGSTARLRIRGTTTLIGNREPLWVLDGIPLSDPVDVTNEQLNDPDYINYIGNAISGINPQDIERIDVLKDAAATALYGVRASNGVIIVTTKKGEPGPPRISYSTQMKYTLRPRYTDSNVNLMNSQERVQFGKELVDLHYSFPANMTMVGYEGAYHRFVTGQTDYAGFLKEVQKAETANTDWFDLLTQNTLNHNHTVSLSGGNESARYYASLGYSKEDATTRTQFSDRYSANLSMQTKVAERVSANIRLNASVNKRNQLPPQINALSYAYNTTRALPAFNEDGSYHYYQRHAYNVGTDKREQYKYRYNILNEINNTENKHESSNVLAAMDLIYRVKNNFEASLTASYQRSESKGSTWFGERTNYVAQLKNGEADATPIPGKFGLVDLPYGGVYNMSTNTNDNFLIRLHTSYRNSFGEQKQHSVYALIGGEINTLNTTGYTEETRGYLKNRGMKYVTMTAEEVEKYPYYASWLAANKPVHSANKTNRLSAYLNASYNYKTLFSISTVLRSEASNKFGSRSNEKFLPTWSLSGMVNFKELFFRHIKDLSDMRLRGSMGKSGNMVDNQTPNLLLRQGSIDTYYGENVTTVYALPNPNLRWEQTQDYSAGLEVSLFDYKLNIGIDAYYRHTTDAFNNINVSSVNGVNEYTMNGSDVYNKGASISLSGYVFQKRNFSWYLSTNYSMVFNEVRGKEANEYSLREYLGGHAILDRESVGTFYSYNFLGLSPENGMPQFDDYADRRHLLEGKTLGEIMKILMVKSGSREPNFQGSIYSTLRYKQLTLTTGFNYSLGNKIRKFALYKEVLEGIPSDHNVRKEFTERWKAPGDERHTIYPAIFSQSDPDYVYYRYHWSTKFESEQGFKAFAENHWNMFDNSNARVVSGNYLRLSNISLRYQFAQRQLKKTPFSNLSFDITMTNVFTLKSSQLKGQDPTQAGFDGKSADVNTLALSMRLAYTMGLRFTF